MNLALQLTPVIRNDAVLREHAQKINLLLSLTHLSPEKKQLQKFLNAIDDEKSLEKIAQNCTTAKKKLGLLNTDNSTKPIRNLAINAIDNYRNIMGLDNDQLMELAIHVDALLQQTNNLDNKNKQLLYSLTQQIAAAMQRIQQIHFKSLAQDFIDNINLINNKDENIFNANELPRNIPETETFILSNSLKNLYNNFFDAYVARYGASKSNHSVYPPFPEQRNLQTLYVDYRKLIQQQKDLALRHNEHQQQLIKMQENMKNHRKTPTPSLDMSVELNQLLAEPTHKNFMEIKTKLAYFIQNDDASFLSNEILNLFAIKAKFLDNVNQDYLPEEIKTPLEKGTALHSRDTLEKINKKANSPQELSEQLHLLRKKITEVDTSNRTYKMLQVRQANARNLNADFFEKILAGTNNNPLRKEIAIAIQKSWENSSPYALCDSPTLQKVILNLKELEDYLLLLTKEVNANSTLKNNPQLATLLYDFNNLLNQKKQELAAALLERLALVPEKLRELAKKDPQQLKQDLQNEEIVFCDDPIYATLAKLFDHNFTDSRPIKSYLLQVPLRKTLTIALMTEFKTFIEQQGSAQQQAQLNDILTGINNNPVNFPIVEQEIEEGFLLVPGLAGEYTKLENEFGQLDLSQSISLPGLPSPPTTTEAPPKITVFPLTQKKLPKVRFALQPEIQEIPAENNAKKVPTRWEGTNFDLNLSNMFDSYYGDFSKTSEPTYSLATKIINPLSSQDFIHLEIKEEKAAKVPMPDNAMLSSGSFEIMDVVNGDTHELNVLKQSLLCGAQPFLLDLTETHQTSDEEALQQELSFFAEVYQMVSDACDKGAKLFVESREKAPEIKKDQAKEAIKMAATQFTRQQQFSAELTIKFNQKLTQMLAGKYLHPTDYQKEQQEIFVKIQAEIITEAAHTWPGYSNLFNEIAQILQQKNLFLPKILAITQNLLTFFVEHDQILQAINYDVHSCFYDTLLQNLSSLDFTHADYHFETTEKAQRYIKNLLKQSFSTHYLTKITTKNNPQVEAEKNYFSTEFNKYAGEIKVADLEETAKIIVEEATHYGATLDYAKSKMTIDNENLFYDTFNKMINTPHLKTEFFGKNNTAPFYEAVVVGYATLKETPNTTAENIASPDIIEKIRTTMRLKAEIATLLTATKSRADIDATSQWISFFRKKSTQKSQSVTTALNQLKTKFSQKALQTYLNQLLTNTPHLTRGRGWGRLVPFMRSNTKIALKNLRNRHF